MTPFEMAASMMEPSLRRAVRRCCCASAAAAVVLVTTLMCGCQAWPWHSTAVPQSVALCRDLSRQGLASIDQGQWSQAEAYFGRAVQACPVDTEARRYYAETLLRRGATVDALAQLDEALRLSASDASLAVRSGEIYLSVGELDAAQRRADLALGIDSSSPDAWALRGHIKQARGDLHQALADLQRGLGLRRDDRQLLAEIAELYRQLGRPERALASLEALAETYPANEEPRELLVAQARALSALQRHPEAAVLLEQALQRGGRSVELQIQLAEEYAAAGDRLRAQRLADETLALAPDLPQARQLAARLAAASASELPRR